MSVNTAPTKLITGKVRKAARLKTQQTSAVQLVAQGPNQTHEGTQFGTTKFKLTHVKVGKATPQTILETVKKKTMQEAESPMKYRKV